MLNLFQHPFRSCTAVTDAHNGDQRAISLSSRLQAMDAAVITSKWGDSPWNIEIKAKERGVMAETVPIRHFTNPSDASKIPEPQAYAAQH